MKGASFIVVGTPISPFVRKVLFCLNTSHLLYRNDPLVPFFGNDLFGNLSPLRRVPVLIDAVGNTVLDSRVICEFIRDVVSEQQQQQANCSSDELSSVSEAQLPSLDARNGDAKETKMTAGRPIKDAHSLSEFRTQVSADMKQESDALPLQQQQKAQRNNNNFINLMPRDAMQRAHCRWLEEYASSRLSDVMLFGVWGLFGIERSVFNTPVDEQKAHRILSIDCPEVLSFVDKHIPDRGFIFGEDPSVADVALSQPIVNALWVKRFRTQSDLPSLFPRVMAFVDRVNQHPNMKPTMDAANAIVKCRFEQHRAELEKIGWPLADLKISKDFPTRGVARFV